MTVTAATAAATTARKQKKGRRGHDSLGAPVKVKVGRSLKAPILIIAGE